MGKNSISSNKELIYKSKLVKILDNSEKALIFFEQYQEKLKKEIHIGNISPHQVTPLDEDEHLKIINTFQTILFDGLSELFPEKVSETSSI